MLIVCSVSTIAIANFKLWLKLPLDSWAVCTILKATWSSPFTAMSMNPATVYAFHWLKLSHTNHPFPTAWIQDDNCRNAHFSLSGFSGGPGFTTTKRDLAFCFTCIAAYQQKHLHAVSCFISTGYSNWKDAVSKFTKHDSSQCHQESVLKTAYHLQLVMLVKCFFPACNSAIWAQCFLKVLSNVQFLARQGLAIRGNESDSNFMSLLNLQSEDDSKLVEWESGFSKRSASTQWW